MEKRSHGPCGTGYDLKSPWNMSRSTLCTSTSSCALAFSFGFDVIGDAFPLGAMVGARCSSISSSSSGDPISQNL